MIAAAFLFLLPATAILGGAATKRPWFKRYESSLWCAFVVCCLASFFLSLLTAVLS